MSPLPLASTEPSIARLGSRIRALRQRRGMTLVQVAELAGLSHPFLSQLERGLTGPSIGSLERIAIALGTSQVELLAADEPAADVASTVLRAGDGPSGPYGLGRARILGPAGLGFTPMECTGDNAERGALHAHSEAEFVVVLEGAVGIDVGETTHRLAEGDAVTIASDAPHRWWSLDATPYRLLIVKEGVRPRLGTDGETALALQEEFA